MQTSQATCGPTSVANALAALGIEVTEATVSRWIDKVRREEHPGVNGTGEMNLARALTEAAPRRYQLGARVLHFTDREDAMYALAGALERGRPVVLAVDPVEDGDAPGNYFSSHWIAAVGRLGHRIILADPADSELVIALTPSQLLVRWETPGKVRTLFGLVITRGKDIE